MSYNSIRSIVKWNDTNKIEEGIRIYRSNDYFDETNLPTPIATLDESRPRGVYADYSGSVGVPRYYRVGAFVGDREVISNALTVTPQRSRVGDVLVGLDTTSTASQSDWRFALRYADGATIPSDVFSFDGSYGRYKTRMIRFDMYGNVYVCGSTTTSSANGFIQFDHEGRYVRYLRNASTSITNARYNPIATDDLNGIVCLWRGGTYTSINRYDMFSSSSFNAISTAAYPYSIACDKYGYTYYGGQSGWVGKFTLSGEVVWEHNDRSSNNVAYVAVDDQQCLYAGHEDGWVRKYDPDGNEIWSVQPHTTQVIDLCVDSFNDQLVIVYQNNAAIRQLRTDTGATVRTNNHGTTSNKTSAVVDVLGDIYAINASGGSGVRRTTHTGSGRWSYNLPVNSTNINNCIDVYPGRFAISQKIPF